MQLLIPSVEKPPCPNSTACRNTPSGMARAARRPVWSPPGAIEPVGNAAGGCAAAADLEWMQTARVFLIDAYEPPFATRLEFDARALIETMDFGPEKYTLGCVTPLPDLE